jgi:hypothetical protein
VAGNELDAAGDLALGSEPSAAAAPCAADAVTISTGMLAAR